ncbi:MAG: carbohydrate ABC transporter permease [Humibacter sp.]
MTRAILVQQPQKRRRRQSFDPGERSVISALDRKRPGVRVAIWVATVVVLVLITIVCVGPLVWLFKAATSTSNEILANPFSLWPSGLHLGNFGEAWAKVNFGQYFLNTLWTVGGTTILGILVATTGGYGLAVLKPKYSKVVFVAVLATLFIPGVVSLVSLYLTVNDLSLLGTYPAVWLPAAASAFNILLVQRFFSGIPPEIFEAARIDGAGPFRIFFSLVLPLSRPVIGVVALLTAIGSYKDFLWPLLALPDPATQPISVVLPSFSHNMPLAQFMAVLFVSVLVPVALFMVFQRDILRAAGNSGAVKG